MFEHQTIKDYYFSGIMLLVSIGVVVMGVAWMTNLIMEGRYVWACVYLIVPVTIILAGEADRGYKNRRAAKYNERMNP